jgi:hypothetical protein
MISDDDLLLYYYRDGLDAAERARIGAALSEQPELAQRLHALVARLDAVSALPEVPVPEMFQRRWADALSQATAKETPRQNQLQPLARPALSPRWMAAAAALAAVALVLSVQFAVKAPEPIIAETPAPDATDAASTADQSVSAYEQGLKFHLASTERQVAALEQATPEERAKLVDTIIGQNRLYALAAERAGEPQLARVLRAFTPVLEDVAAGRGESRESVAQLGFELRVMQARLGAARTPSSSL